MAHNVEALVKETNWGLDEARSMGYKVYKGKICKRHPHIFGLRRVASGCYLCSRVRTREYRSKQFDDKRSILKDIDSKRMDLELER